MGFCGNISFHFPETNVQEDAGVNIILVPWEPAEKCLTFFPGQTIHLPVWLCLWCIKKATGLASKSFLPILWFVHSWICSHVAGNRLISSPVLLSSSVFRGSFFFFSFFFLLNIIWLCWVRIIPRVVPSLSYLQTLLHQQHGCSKLWNQASCAHPALKLIDWPNSRQTV